MGVARMPTVADYWSTAPHMPEHPLVKNSGMTLTRFQQLKRFLHISDPADDLNESSTWLSKIAPALECVRSSSRRCYSASETICVDEMMVSFVGRSRHTVVIKTKPDPRGHLVYAAVDARTRFVIDFLVHSNETGVPELPAETKKKYGSRAGTFHHLSQAAGHRVRSFADNAFCSIQALSDLRELGIGGAGAARHNCKHLPDRLRQAKKQGTVAPCAVESATVMSVNVALWSDAKIASMLSTARSVEGEDAWEPKMRRKQRSGPSAPLFGEPREMKKMPKLVGDCSKHMGGCALSIK